MRTSPRGTSFFFFLPFFVLLSVESQKIHLGRLGGEHRRVTPTKPAKRPRAGERASASVGGAHEPPLLHAGKPTTTESGHLRCLRKFSCIWAIVGRDHLIPRRRCSLANWAGLKPAHTPCISWGGNSRAYSRHCFFTLHPWHMAFASSTYDLSLW